MKLGELVDLLGGKLVQGRAETEIGGVNSTVQAGPEDVVFAQDEVSATDALSTNAGAVVLRPGVVKAYPPGCLVVLPGDTPHFHWAKSGEYVTQVTAIGPLGLEYMDSKDDPRNKRS